MEKTVLGEINRLRQMSVAELQREWEGIFGSPPTITNQQHLWKRLCWELQARAHGGLSNAAMTRLDEQGEAAWNRATSKPPARPGRRTCQAS